MIESCLEKQHNKYMTLNITYIYKIKTSLFPISHCGSVYEQTGVKNLVCFLLWAPQEVLRGNTFSFSLCFALILTVLCIIRACNTDAPSLLVRLQLSLICANLFVFLDESAFVSWDLFPSRELKWLWLISLSACFCRLVSHSEAKSLPKELNQVQHCALQRVITTLDGAESGDYQGWHCCLGYYSSWVCYL